MLCDHSKVGAVQSRSRSHVAPWGKSVGAISTSRYLPFVHGLDASTANAADAPIFIAPAKLLSFKFAVYPDQK
jgi:hypothetical protein